LCQTRLDGVDLIVSRTGFSGEVGYELYPFNATDTGDQVWEALLEVGQPFGIAVIAPGHIRRLEAGILSYHADMDENTNPFEVGLDWQVHLDKKAFVGQAALRQIYEHGVKRRIAGVRIGGTPQTWYNEDFWPVMSADDSTDLGYVTSAFYSPRLETNIGLAMLPVEQTAEGTQLTVHKPDDGAVTAEVVRTPFHDPNKAIPRQ
jgi:aminomethyltransferase